MKVKVGWILLVPALVVAIAAGAVVVCAHVRPRIDSQELLNITTLMRTIAFSGLGFSVLAALAASIIRLLRWRKAPLRIGAFIGPFPRYFQVCQTIMGVAFLEIIFSTSAECWFAAGKWMAAGGRGYPPHEISESEAIISLWGNLRAHSATLLIVAMMWMLFAGALIFDELRRCQLEAKEENQVA